MVPMSLIATRQSKQDSSGYETYEGICIKWFDDVEETVASAVLGLVFLHACIALASVTYPK